MDHDDLPIGRLLTRREMLQLIAVVAASSGAAAVAGCANRLTGGATPSATTLPGATAVSTLPAIAAATTSDAPAGTAAVAGATVPLPVCVVRPEQTEGPFFIDEQLNRSDIRAEPSDGSLSAGAPLALRFNVSRVGEVCVPLAGAVVDVWHCDAAGVYSGVDAAGRNAAGRNAATSFLRGFQVTDNVGAASFTTIYPGWYPGRSVHIHFKIRAQDGGTNREFTSQLYFDDDFTDRVYTAAPYSDRPSRNTRNQNDSVFGGGGDLLTLNVTESGGGYAAAFDIGLQI